NSLKSFLIGAIFTVFIVGGAAAAIFAAWRMNQPGPVAPTVPQITPHASEPDTAACSLTFTVAPPPPGLKCDLVTVDPNDLTISNVSKTRNLTVSGSGGTGDLTYSWTATGGSISPSTGKNVTWTAPSSFGNKSQSWTITATVKDSTGATATSDACKVKLEFNTGCDTQCTSSSDCPSDLTCSSGKCRKSACVSQSDCKCPVPPKVCNDTCLKTEECGGGLICAGGNCRNSACITQPSCACPPPRPVCNTQCSNSGDCPSNLACVDGRCRNAACSDSSTCVCPRPVSYHKSCNVNHACVTVTGAGADTCTSDASCQPIAPPPPIPKSGVELPTILTIVGGVALLAIGLLAL
ncbi:PKD domain-containing protein, partial [Candidatus Microgenomates bacterium]|nr:PKD domain-containing protein [Candidatus Microgenomates bacterium]